jgi:hypothetical protein
MPRSIREPELSYLPWSAICLTPSGRQDEFLASQYPDGSIVFSGMLKDEQVMSFLLVPPCTDRGRRARTRPTGSVHRCRTGSARDCEAWRTNNPAGSKTAKSASHAWISNRSPNP